MNAERKRWIKNNAHRGFRFKYLSQITSQNLHFQIPNKLKQINKNSLIFSISLAPPHLCTYTIIINCVHVYIIICGNIQMHIHKINNNQTWQGEQPNALKLKKAAAKEKTQNSWSRTKRHRQIGFHPMPQIWYILIRKTMIILTTTLNSAAAAAAKSLQSCPTLCDPIDISPPGSPVPGILQARTLEWVAISFSNVWKWKVKVKSLSRVQLLATPWTAAYQAPLSMGFSRQEYWSGVPLPSPLKS